MNLKKYRSKRNFKMTSEPSGLKSASSENKTKKQNPLLYVIQKHAARHLHYDLRLEINHVLKSWAIPKGPHLNPNIKRLAVEVEDHPIEYGSFEGTIPAGEYGAGAVILWDKGQWIPEGDPNIAYKNGSLTFQIKGRKLKGKWKLIKTKTNGLSHQKYWLFFKIKDKDAKEDYEIIEDKPLSVISHKTIEQINKSSRQKLAKSKVVKKKKNEIQFEFDLSKDARLKKTKMPAEIKPELCYLTKNPPEGLEWIHEVKFDGYRILAFVDKNEKQQIRLMTRNGKNWTQKFTHIAKSFIDLPIKNAIFDGELVAIDKNGVSNFQYLQNSLKGEIKYPLRYYVFDILYYNGYNLRNLPLLDRKRILKAIVNHPSMSKDRNTAQENILYSEYIQGEGTLVYKKACANKLEGIISKKINSPYETRRSKLWLKSKCIKRQEFVIGGYTKPRGKRLGFGSLLVGYYNSKKQLIYAGHVGTGFNEKTLKSLYKMLKGNLQNQNPFYKLQEHSIIKFATWVKPKLIAELEFTEWTKENILRHPAFLGLRLDKSVGEVGLEAEEILKPLKSAQKKSHSRNRLENKIDSINVAGIKLSHPTRIIKECKSVTKIELAKYYEKVSGWILPYIINRPLSLLRCPFTSEKKYGESCFFNKHYSKSFPPSIYPVGGVDNFLMIKNLEGLIALVQLNVLEIHPWGSKNTAMMKPDRIIFDLDPDINLPWKQVIMGAELVNKELKKINLISFVKTTGGKGLHIVIPILAQNSWDQIKIFTETFSRFMAEKYPELFTATMSKSKRKGKIYLDYLRNTKGATSVAPYSTRAKEGCPISTPIAWSELKKTQSSQQFTLLNILDRLNKIKKDPWDKFFQIKQNLPNSF